MDLDEVAHDEPPHQDLRCLQIQLFSSLVYVSSNKRKHISRCLTVSDSNCETQDYRYDFRTVFVTPNDSVCEVKTNISTKEAEIVCKKVYNSYITDIVLSHAFPSALLCERSFLRIWCVAKYILVDRKTTNFVENK